MAWEHGLLDIGAFTAAGNYSSAAAQYRVVKLSSGTVSINVASSQPTFGVLQDRPSSGFPALIRTGGVTKVRVLSTAHGAIAVGNKLCASTLSKQGGVINSTLASRYVIGRALEALGAATTGIITMLITHEGAGSTGTAAAA